MPYVSTCDAAKHYSVTERTIRNWCKAGEIRAKRCGKLWRVWIDDQKGTGRQQETAQNETSVTFTLGADYTWKTVS